MIAIEEVNVPKCRHLASGLEEVWIFGVTVQHVVCQNALLLLPEIFSVCPRECRRLIFKLLAFYCVITATAEKVDRSNLELKREIFKKFYIS